MLYPIAPCPKPRMSQRDKWAARPIVLRYRAFCDEARLRGIVLPESGASIVFHIPMPRSWPKGKKIATAGSPHQSRPDLSNLLKALEDAVCREDSVIWNYTATKVWAWSGAIEIKRGPEGPK